MNFILVPVASALPRHCKSPTRGGGCALLLTRMKLIRFQQVFGMQLVLLLQGESERRTNERAVHNLVIPVAWDSAYGDMYAGIRAGFKWR